MQFFQKPSNQRGSILLIFLISIPFLILIATYYMQLSLTSFQVARLDELHTQAQLAADAGADYGIEQISADNTWSGTTGEVTLHSDSSTRTTYQASVVSGTGTKTLTVIGRSYWPAPATTATRSVRISVDLRPVTSGNFSIISGEGGLYMSNSAKVVGGDVFINGEINMQNSAQIGLSTSPVTVNVADDVCPSTTAADYPTNYPRQCTSTDGAPQPISISNTAHIYGTVKATNQTDGSGMSGPGLVSGSVAPQPLPTYDRAAQKAAVATTITNTAASCSNNQSLTYAANTKITGNVTIAGKCKVTVNGDVWITGSLTLSNQAQLIVSNTLGSTMPHIMIDGAAGLSLKNSSQLVQNSSNTGFEIITFYSTASCSPDCSSVTGLDLINSRGISTITLNNSGDATNTIFYSYWSQVELDQSGQVGAIIGQTIKLTNTGTITFGGGVNTGNYVWIPKGYRRG